MSAIRAVIADDEKPARDELTFILREMDDVEVVGEADNGLDAYNLIERESPDLVLLDVQMPGLDGFQLVREIRTLPHSPLVIFVTAYDHYAIQAFEVSALDYLLKPVARDRLVQAVGRVRPLIEQQSPLDETLSRFIENLPKRTRHLTRIPVRRRKNLHLLDVNDMIYGYVRDGLVFIVTDVHEDMVSYRTLDEFASDLDPDMFHRVHRSYLANVDHIRQIIPQASGNYELLMDNEDGTRIPLSRQHARELRRIYKW